MKRIINEIISSEVEVEIPCYIKLGENVFYNILNETEMAVVKTYSFTTLIEIVNMDQHDPFGCKGWEFTTKEEFQKAFDTAFERLSTLEQFPNMIPA